MNFFSNLFGNVTATILRLALIAGTLALVYVFAIRPVLDTTEEAFNTFQPLTEQSQKTLEQAQQQLNQAFDQPGTNSIQRQIQRQIRESAERTQRAGGPDPQQLLRCVEQARQDAQKLRACAKRFGSG